MSLQVWIDTAHNNKGLSDVAISCTGVFPINIGDSITGSCFGLSNDCYNINTGYGNGLSTDEKSIAVWVKPIEANDSKMLLRTTGTTPGRLYLGIKNSTWNLGYDNNTWGYTSDAPVIVNEWQHICITIKHGIATLYYNGKFIETKSGTDFIMPSNIIFSPSGSVFTGFCDDIRIYDHCLSPKEVYDIAKGLVLHYKLDNIPNKNLVSSLKSCSNDSYLAYQFNLSENFVAGQTYTFQLWDVNVAHSGKTESQLGISIFWGGGSVSLKAMNGTSWFTNGHADYIKFSITITSSQASGSGATNSWINIYNSVPSATGTRDMSIGAIKIEKGSNTTEYTPYNEVATQVTDSSGYNYPGTITGSLSVTNDTPRYNYATHFDGSSYIKRSRNIIPGQIKTISFWANWDSIPSGQSVLFVDSATNTGFGLMSTGILLTTSGAGSSYTYPKSGIVANTWYHFVIVITSATGRNLYINGVKQTPTSNQSVWTYNVNELQIGKRSTTSDGFVGKMSDFRIYAKALSADDIKELYDTAALIDNIGNLECYEIIENDQTPEINKKGQAAFGKFIEKVEYLYLPAGTWVSTGLNYENGDSCKAITIIRYEANGSGRDLMGYSASGGGYWGVKADGTWENHGTITHTNSDITQINTVVYQFSSSNEHGIYIIGALISSYSVRNKYIYNVMLYKNDVLECNLVPAKQENQCGLVDIISGTFYPCNNSNGSISTDNSEAKIFEDYVESNQFLEI